MNIRSDIAARRLEEQSLASSIAPRIGVDTFETGMSAKKKTSTQPLAGAALLKETCRRIRTARSYWEAHNNRACRGEREKAMALYESMTDAEREKVPPALRVWLRYRSEKYFGADRRAPRRGRG